MIACMISRMTNAWYRRLWVQVLLAMAIGILLGVLRPRLGAQMQPLGDGFIKAIRMLIAPIIFCTVVHGVARMTDMARVGRVAIKAIVYFEVLTTVALVIGLVAVNVLQPGKGMNVDLSHVDSIGREAVCCADAKSNRYAIPAEHHSADVYGRVRRGQRAAGAADFCAVRICADASGRRGASRSSIDRSGFGRAVRHRGIVMWAAPLGAFGAIAFTVGRFGAGSLVSLGKTAGRLLSHVPDFCLRCAVAGLRVGSDSVCRN